MSVVAISRGQLAWETHHCSAVRSRLSRTISLKSECVCVCINIILLYCRELGWVILCIAPQSYYHWNSGKEDLQNGACTRVGNFFRPPFLTSQKIKTSTLSPVKIVWCKTSHQSKVSIVLNNAYRSFAPRRVLTYDFNAKRDIMSTTTKTVKTTMIIIITIIILYRCIIIVSEQSPAEKYCTYLLNNSITRTYNNNIVWSFFSR